MGTEVKKYTPDLLAESRGPKKGWSQESFAAHPYPIYIPSIPSLITGVKGLQRTPKEGSLMKELRVVITRHARRRMKERGADLAQLKRAIRQAADQAPRSPQTTAVVAKVLGVCPIVKFCRQSAIVMTVLAPGARIYQACVVEVA